VHPAWISLAILLAAFVGGLAGAWAVSRPQVFTLQRSGLLAPDAFIPNTGRNNFADSIAGEVYARVNLSVVQVNTIDQFTDGSSSDGNGSGVVVSPDGLVLTNYHVVRDSVSIQVVFASGETRDAVVADADDANDLAVLKLDLPPGIPAAILGDSESVRVGDVAIAIGSPFGLDQTVTQGIISAIHRQWKGPDSSPQSLIQTDAPINPGNSGGPLLNARGEVIGINTMIQSPIYGSVGIGFAVPVNVARKLIE
jgi:S1-C subfamily serine protease